MARVSKCINLTNDEINALNNLACSSDPTLARRARVILECNKGLNNKEVSALTGMNKMDVARWRNAYLESGVDGLSGKRNGSGARSDSEREKVVDKIRCLLSKNDQEWTADKLMKETGATKNAVNYALKKLDVSLQRTRKWGFATDDELIVKSVDIVGLYITRSEQAVIICNSKDSLPESRGEFITRNRELSLDFQHYDGSFSLADGINTAARHINDESKQNPVSLRTFLDQTLSSFPEDDAYEYHLLVYSSVSNGYRGVRLRNVYQTWLPSTDDWLDMIRVRISELADHSLLNADLHLYDSLERYLDKCKDTTAPLMWKKVMHAEQRVTAGQNSKPEFSAGSENSAFLDDMREVFHKHMSDMNDNDSQIRCGFISFAFDHDDVRLQMDMDHKDIPHASDTWYESLDHLNAMTTEVEKSLIRLRNEAGIHMAELCCDLLKKNSS